ncbi:MAG TPA: TIGR03435 family protein [Bryobacteraceae bacterium]|nr:TIGR03435 family protein [Bryobacteraceae bacterium]
MEKIRMMKKTSFCAALIAVAAFGQDAATFEVATIKPSAPLDAPKMMAAIQSGEPMPIGPHVGAHGAEYLYMNLKSLIVHAYQVKPYQVSGPDWLDQQRFDIVAKYPYGATKADAPRMLRSLLEERFRLKVHKSTEEHSVLALVAGRGGPKLKASAGKPMPIDENAPLKPGERMVDGPAGKPMLVRTDLASGAVIVDIGEQGRMSYRIDRSATSPVIHIEFSMVTMTGFASMVTQVLTQLAGGAARQVVDLTEIKGNYEASLDLSVDDMIAMVRKAGLDIPPSANGASGAAVNDGSGIPIASDPGAGLSLTDAVRSMGLRLESRKAPVEQLIVDHAERKPTDN